MVRILFSSLPSFGHTYPLIPLAVAARRAGHQVVFATGEQFAAVVTGQGLEFAAAGMEIREAFATVAPDVRPSEVTPELVRPLLGRVFGEVLPRRFATDLAPVLDRVQPDLVVQEVGNPGAGIAARAAGIAVVQHNFGRVDLDNAPFDLSMLQAVAEEFGAPLSRPAMIDICPPSLQSPDLVAKVDRIPLRPDLVDEPGEPVDYRTTRPLVYLTLGTAMGTVAVLRRAIDGLATLDVDILVAAGPTIDTGALGHVPSNVAVRAWVRHTDLLPHVALAVHHGGSGTTLGVLANGAPQLFLPQGADQFTNAAAVSALGAGSTLPAEFGTEDIAAAAKELLADPAHPGAAQAVAAEIAGMPAPATVVDQLTAHP